MSRVTRWRYRCPEKVRLRQEAVLNPGGGGETGLGSPRIFLLRRTGPAAFVIKEDGKRNELKVWLGDPHTCTCAVFQAENELCQHICWCLLKVFRLKSDDCLSYQLGLVPRDISHLLHERGKSFPEIPEVKHETALPHIPKGTSECPHPRRRATESDVCPICLENILERRHPVTHCRYGCGNLVHISCMLVWAKHAEVKECNGELMLICPLCRGDFGTQKLLKEESRNAPRMRVRMRLQRQDSEGKREKQDRSLQNCRNPRKNPSKVWQRKGFLPPINSLPQNKDHDMGSLNRCKSFHETHKTNVHDLDNIPRIRIHKSHRLLVRGQQCCLCLSPYQRGEYACTLPFCAHSFHSDCLKRWTEDHGVLFAVCPIDGSRIASASPDRLTEHEAVLEGVSSVMSSKPSIDHGNKASEDVLKSLSSSFIVKRLLIPARQPCKSPAHASEDRNEEEIAERVGRDEGGSKEAAAAKKHKRTKKALRPAPPLLVQLSPRNASVESSAASSSENASAMEREEARVVCRRRHPFPKYPGYIPVAAMDLAAVGPCLSVKALPVQPFPAHDAVAVVGAASRSPSRLLQRTPQRPEAFRCHRYQNPPQPLLWSHHRAKHSHQQYGGEPRDLAATSDSSQDKLLQCSRMRLSPKSPPVRGQWDDLLWDSIEESDSGGRPVRKDI